MSKVQKSIKINGMTCVNCALNVERAVKKAGIQNAVVNFSTRELIIEDITGIDETLVEKIITQSGFEVVKVGEAPKSKRLDDIFFYSVIVIAIYFMIQMFFPMHWKNVWVDFILATPALLVGISKFGSGAWHSLKAGSANMYVLILLGAITAYVFSIFLAVRGEHMVYFETTAVIIALVMLGDKLEEKAINKTTSALSSLATMQIQKAKKKIGDFFEEVSLNEVKKGDLVQVNEGDQIPTDGFIIDGSALVNEALLTGESEPIFKEKNALIYSGSIILNGQFTYEVSKPGHESALARINQLVQKASTEKANIQKLADRISAVFVPLIITIAFVWFFVAYYFLHLGFEQSIIRSVAILVISCPCAMGLATPMAVMVAIGKLSENGILIKGAQTIETFAGVKNMLFDKTGTLTTGAFTLTNFKSYAIDENEAKAIILALENKSSHPIALSIQKQFNHLTAFPLENITEIKGKGIQATDMLGNQYKLGSAHFTQLNQIEADIYLTKNDKLIASFNIKDTLKDKVKDTLSYYQSNKFGVKW